jgi:hypothetical protein
VTEEITFERYIEMLREFLAAHPEAKTLKVFVGNGYCTSEEYVRLSRTPFIRPLLGRMAKRHPGDVVMLL